MRGSMSRRDAYEKGALSLRGSRGRARARSVGVEWECEGMRSTVRLPRPLPPLPRKLGSPLSYASLPLILISHRYSTLPLTSHRSSSLPLTPSRTIRRRDDRQRNIGYLMAEAIIRLSPLRDPP